MRVHDSLAQRWCITIGFVLLASCNSAGDRFADSAAGATADSAAVATVTPDRAGAASAAGGSAASRGADSATEMNADAMHPAAATAAAPVRSAPADSNQAFLRMMSDHHHGLVVLVDSAFGKLNAARTDADTLRQKQRRGRDDMMQILNTEYDDPITPAMMPSNRSMLAAVMQAGSAEADRQFYQQTVAHHREGVKMIDRYMPFLSGRPKTLATNMRAEQEREIATLERKSSRSR